MYGACAAMRCGAAVGGFKHSGIGRELGQIAVNNYLENKTVVFNTALTGKE